MFYESATNLDDLMRPVLSRLLSNNRKDYRVTSKKGKSTEIFGALLELTNPRARLSRSRNRSKVFSALGEVLWYLSGSNEVNFISYYMRDYICFSDDGKTANGAYGPRLFGLINSDDGKTPRTQWQRVIKTLRKRKGSRNGVIQIFANRDAEIESKDIPCTCALQFVIRNDRVHLHVHMRSNDAFRGLPHDIFSFTMLQEVAARELGYELGIYQHSVSSLHLYDDDDKMKSRIMAQEYLDEGLHDIVPMPAMPKGDPWPSIHELIRAEAEIRQGNLTYEPPKDLDPYWLDLIILLKAYGHTRGKETQGDDMAILTKNITSPVYTSYVLDRIERKLGPAQWTLDLFDAEKR